jgi:hypothetical protein
MTVRNAGGLGPHRNAQTAVPVPETAVCAG